MLGPLYFAVGFPPHAMAHFAQFHDGWAGLLGWASLQEPTRSLGWADPQALGGGIWVH